jgi:hypothetical protein
LSRLQKQNPSSSLNEGLLAFSSGAADQGTNIAHHERRVLRQENGGGSLNVDSNEDCIPLGDLGKVPDLTDKAQGICLGRSNSKSDYFSDGNTTGNDFFIASDLSISRLIEIESNEINPAES